MLLLALACARTAPPGEMIPIPGGVVRVGTRQAGPVPGFVMRPPDTAPAGLPDLGSAGHPIGAAPGAGGAGPAAPGGATAVPGGAPAMPPRLHGLPGAPQDVTVAPFSIDRTEVTNAQYGAFLVATGYRVPYVDEPWAQDGWNWSGPTGWPRGLADHPVVLVSWYDAREYCAWAEKRLPTEAEWQLAVLGPAADEPLYPWGNDYDPSRLNHGTVQTPNYDDSDGWERTSPVGAFPTGASRSGVLDGFGNAWEWVADARVEGGFPMLYAAVRGGAFFFDFRPNPTGERSGFPPELRRKSSGFRCAK